MANVIDIIAKVREAEPRIDSLPEYSRIAVAGMLLAGMSFDEASAQFTDTLTKAAAEVKVQRDTQKASREKVLAEFEAAIYQPVFDAAAKIEADKRPQGSFTIVVDYATPQKNADGSPAMDANNNPVHGIGISTAAKWTVKTPGQSTGSNLAPSSTGNRGRIGKVFLNGTEYGSLKDAAKAVGVDSENNVKLNLVNAGYSVSDRQRDAAGKTFVNVTKNGTANNGTANVPTQTPTQEVAF
jgi:hypothetical protein